MGLAAALLAMAGPAPAQAPVAPFRVQGDGIAQPLAGLAGDVARGRRITADRQVGTCLLCHAGPFPEERFQGTIGPDLAGVGTRLTAAQIRLRVVDPRRLAPETIMPAYHSIAGRTRVGAAWRDRPILDAQQVEDVVAFLATLRDPS
ncbi:sulfur-oxidizing protein SoxX [Stella humosa]|uniref:Sulfur-oxidizing protein SoxX n=1 Tax=Stella humosa TaxID=94 RepID=A0A3N1KR94_9PROT|nr:sulfur oxidation c-type cytochrome SoxX [Stella humosa]ROP81319.1 sulfur-oxidizing protein SoxX [Stella humosa]BBK32668.1 sulfur oxidation c-type cytochrome SoxX [Stella humosa]